jgi:hypothetical protein
LRRLRIGKVVLEEVSSMIQIAPPTWLRKRDADEGWRGGPTARSLAELSGGIRLKRCGIRGHNLANVLVTFRAWA